MAAKKGKKLKLTPSRIKQMAKVAARKITKKLAKTIQKRQKKKAQKAKEQTAPKVYKTHHVNATEWANTGVWVHVKSSNVSAIKFDIKDQLLFVEFHPDKSKPPANYVYHKVPTQTAKDMFSADSMGKFVWRRLRGKFGYSRLN